MQSRLTLIGLDNYLSDENHPHVLFQYLTLPANTLNKEYLIDTILMRGGEYEVIYPNAEFCSHLMKSWSAKYANTIERWFNAFNSEYNPIHNYDRHEEWNEKRDGTDSRNTDGSSTTNVDTQATDRDTGTVVDDGTNETKVSAFNSSSYQPKEKVDTDNTRTDDLTHSHTGDEDTSNEFEQNESGEFEDETIHEGHLYGNIGVMSTQEMIQKEFELYLTDLYDDVADLFLHDFVIPVS